MGEELTDERAPRVVCRAVAAQDEGCPSGTHGTHRRGSESRVMWSWMGPR